MTYEVPQQLKPVTDFAVQVVVGAGAFLVVFLVAVAISALVKVVEATGYVPRWVITGTEYGEKALFGVDFFCFGLFLLSEVLKLARGLWKEGKA